MEESKSVDCGRRVVRAYKPTPAGVKVTVFKPRCKAWDCPHCRVQKSNAITKRITAFLGENQAYFYTLTFFQNESPEYIWQEMPKRWNLFRTRISQIYGRFEFVRVVESHKKRPFPHLHILATVNISETVLGAVAVECGFGYQIKKVKVNRSGVAAYMAKYLAKPWTNQEAAEIRKYLKIRVVSYSRGFPKLPGEAKEAAVYVQHNQELCAAETYKNGLAAEFGDGYQVAHIESGKRAHSYFIRREGGGGFITLSEIAARITAHTLVLDQYRQAQSELYVMPEDREQVLLADAYFSTFTKKSAAKLEAEILGRSRQDIADRGLKKYIAIRSGQYREA
jgi:hypothetical protein